MNEQKEQPTLEVKKATLRGENTGWSFRFKAPDVCTTFWGDDGWIAFIGDNWYKTEQKETAQHTILVNKLNAPYPFCHTPEICSKDGRCHAEYCCAD